MLHFAEYIKILVALLVIVNPISAVPIFVSMTTRHSEAERKLTPEQRARRDGLERAVFVLREKKGQMADDEYYRQLEERLLELARFYESNAPAIVAPSTTK